MNPSTLYSGLEKEAYPFCGGKRYSKQLSSLQGGRITSFNIGLSVVRTVHVYTVLSFYFIMGNRKGVTNHPFFFSQSSSKKRSIEIWSVMPIFVFSFARWNRKKGKACIVYTVLYFSFSNSIRKKWLKGNKDSFSLFLIQKQKKR